MKTKTSEGKNLKGKQSPPVDAENQIFANSPVKDEGNHKRFVYLEVWFVRM